MLNIGFIEMVGWIEQGNILIGTNTKTKSDVTLRHSNHRR
jgi:hypothetical protein